VISAKKAGHVIGSGVEIGSCNGTAAYVAGSNPDRQRERERERDQRVKVEEEKRKKGGVEMADYNGAEF
jgi:nucleoid-associated protein YgaU